MTAPNAGTTQAKSAIALSPATRSSGAEHDGARYAPEEQASLAARIQVELLEHEREHEDVVDAQAELDQVAGQVLLRGLGTPAQEDQGPECQPEAHAGERDDGVPRP